MTSERGMFVALSRSEMRQFINGERPLSLLDKVRGALRRLERQLEEEQETPELFEWRDTREAVR